jgi:hypothetical protein
MTDLSNVEVRRYNGQCEYGPWMGLDDESLPVWVGELVAGEVAETDAGDGEVSEGGATFRWRKV